MKNKGSKFLTSAVFLLLPIKQRKNKKKEHRSTITPGYGRVFSSALFVN